MTQFWVFAYRLRTIDIMPRFICLHVTVFRYRKDISLFQVFYTGK